MEFYDVIAARKSCREYLERPVTEQQLLRVLEAARLAPSWRNFQCWRYIVVSDRQVIHKLSIVLKNNPSENAYQCAPYIIILCAYPGESGNMFDKQYYLADCGISMEHLCLAASNEGLGTCWVGWFNETGVKNVLDIPEDVRVVALTPLGYPSGNYKERSRKELSQIVFYNKWGTRSINKGE